MIDYDESCMVLWKWQGSVVPKAGLYALPAACIAIALLVVEDEQEDFLKDSGLSEVSQSFMWNAVTAVIAILLGFRTRQALGRFWEGTSLLHQMRGEWFDASSCLMTFSRDARVSKGKVEEVMEFRHTLLRLMSLMHASALDEISATEDENHYEVLDIQGLDTETLKFLRSCKASGFNRVEALQHMIQVLVTHNHHSGVLTIPPPILSRIYQTLSRGLVNLLNAKKIKDTMFPFPYSQIIMVLLIVQTVFTPVIITQHVEQKWLAAVVSFFPPFGMFCLNFVAGELEMPFGVDDNDLPLRHFQEEMNGALLMLIHDMADHLPHTSKKAFRDFRTLETFVKEDATLAIPSNTRFFKHENFFDEISASGPPVPHKCKATPLVDAACAAPPPPKPTEANPPPLADAPKPPEPKATEVKAAEPIKLRPPPKESSETAECQIQSSQEWMPWLMPQPPGVRAAGALTGTPALPKIFYELDNMYAEWSRKTDIQVQELQKNTKCMDAFVDAFPKLVAQHSEACAGLSQVIKTLESAPQLRGQAPTNADPQI